MKKSDIQIATPCGQDWQAMAPKDKARFCGECKKVVHDLSSMREREAKQLMAAPATEGLCVRYMYDEVGNVWFADTMFMRTEGLLKKVAAVAALAATPFLTACMGAYAGDGFPVDGVSQTETPTPDPVVIGTTDAGPGADADPGADAGVDPGADPDASADPDAATDPDPNADPDATVDPDPNADPDAAIDPGPNAEDAGVPAADDAGTPPHCRDKRGHRRRCDRDGGPRRPH